MSLRRSWSVQEEIISLFPVYLDFFPEACGSSMNPDSVIRPASFLVSDGVEEVIWFQELFTLTCSWNL